MITTTKLPRKIAVHRASVQTRLAEITAFGVALAVLVIGLATYFNAKSAMYSQLDQELMEVALYASGPVSSDIEGLGGLSASALQAANATLLLVRTDGTVRRVQGLRETVDYGSPEVAIARLQAGSSTRTAEGTDGTYYRLVAIPLNTGSGHYSMVIGRPLGPTIETLKDIQNIIIFFGSIFVILAGGLGFLTGRNLMRPLNDLSKALTHVTETDELEPIGTYTDDELGDLTRIFDKMMLSLDSSRERQRRLIADAGHELRTPLTSMRTNVELLVADQKSAMLPAQARAEILGDVAAQLGEFTSLVGDLVQLSRDDRETTSPEPLDFADVVDHAIDRAKRRGSGIHFDVAIEPVTIVGQADTLERAVTNLLDNAVKFSPAGGTIYVRLHQGKLVIWDEGPGIAEEDLPKIFDRFYRSEKARNTPGTGLGLAIVAHIINAHGGTVEASNQPDAGAKFVVELPVTAKDTSPE